MHSRSRTRFALALALSTLLGLSTVGVVLADPRPSQYVLPGTAVYPEGIAFEEETGYFFVSSTTDGTVFRGHVSQPVAEVFLAPGEDGRTTAVGVAVDREGRLYVAGGATGKVFVYDSSSGDLVGVWTTPAAPAIFLNDLVVAPNGDVFITDSQRPIIWRIPGDAVDAATGGTYAAEAWLNYTGTAIVHQPGFNLNGIEISGDGAYLVVVQSGAGFLFRIDVATKTPTRIDLDGALVQAGDGMALRGRTLWVSRNSAGIIVKIALSGDMLSGDVVSETTDPSLRFPTTIDLARGRMLVVNSQFNRRATMNPELPFTVSSIPIP
jgi:Cu-Zn family superoxide dismutase